MSTTGWSTRAPAAILWFAFRLPLNIPLKSCAIGTTGRCSSVSSIVLSFCWRWWRSGLGRWRCCIPGWGRTSSPRWTAASSNCICARIPEPASKTRRACAIRWRDDIRSSDPASGVGHHHRQHRGALLGPESFLLELGPRGHRRRRHPGVAGREASAHVRVHARACATN